MRSKAAPLLCELHAHTTWSDGTLALPDVVDLYGTRGFDVLCVTDHVVRSDDPFFSERARREVGVGSSDHAAYLAQISAETERARVTYGLLVVPGLELTYNDLEPRRAAHALALGCRSFVSVDAGIDGAMEAARDVGAAIVGAHPYRSRRGSSQARTTQRFSRDWRRLEGLVHRYELFNRFQLFGWVAEAGLPGIASGDFHRREHLAGWKTLLPCTKDEAAVVAYLRSQRPVYLARLHEFDRTLAECAA